MLVEELDLPALKIKQLKKKKLNTTEDILYNFPRKYADFRIIKDPSVTKSDSTCIMKGTIKSINKKTSASGTDYIECHITEYHTCELIKVLWFSQEFIYHTIEGLEELDVVVAGTFKSDEWGYSFVNPIIFTTDIASGTKIFPVYSQISGMSDSYYKNIVDDVLKNFEIEDELSEDFRKTFGLISEKQMILNYHHPNDIDDIKAANKKQTYNKLYKLSYKILTDTQNLYRATNFIPRKLTYTNEFIDNLPYELTNDQKNVFLEYLNKARKGIRVNALIQGDVGAGKTVCAFLLMFTMADNGYQSVLMAPTGILAKQHYEELKSYADKYGYKTVYLGGDLKAKEKREVLKSISSGEAKFIVGTHAVISDSVKFKKLGLTICDEEQKFGVVQRESLREKASEGVHSISMSATPIPRSLAIALYGEGMDIYTIETMPNGRKPIKTAIVNNNISAFMFMEKEIKAGHQCYIVCPLIESSDADNSFKPFSVEDILKQANDYFYTSDTHVVAKAITGKMKDEEKSKIIDSFQKNEIQILIATTIVEVGVNNPNATVITIMNAERFGLSGLHQLRGRVGRSKLQSYCMLMSTDTENERLNAMVNSTNGFEIAEADLKLRGSGDLVGFKQSGDDESVKLMLAYPQIYKNIKNYIKEREVYDEVRL